MKKLLILLGLIVLISGFFFNDRMGAKNFSTKKTVPVQYPVESKSNSNPIPSTPENLEIGMDKYETFCSMCHGLSGKGSEEVTKSLEVEPSSLVSLEVKARSDGELFWATSNGVNETKMLAWGELLSKEEIWLIINHIRVLQKSS